MRKTLVRYVNEQMQAGDLVAIIRTSAGPRPTTIHYGQTTTVGGESNKFAGTLSGMGMSVRFFLFSQMRLSVLPAPYAVDPGTRVQLTMLIEWARLADSEATELNQMREETFAVGTLGGNQLRRERTRQTSRAQVGGFAV